MSTRPNHFDLDITLQTLKYATRQLVAEHDLEQLVFRALDSVADFSQSQRLALILQEDDTTRGRLLGTLLGSEFKLLNESISLKNPVMAKVLETKQAEPFYCKKKHGKPVPGHQLFSKGNPAFCLPLIGIQNKVVGYITLVENPNHRMDRTQFEILNVLTTLIASALENAKLFQLATVDSLTGLYVRRYFDIRLQEEIARLHRVESELALIITDIDHFKKVNDTYGHQQGDIILTELADIFRNTIRKDLDIPCRYGGEEFIIICPSTNLEGAVVLAERLRKRCKTHKFSALKGDPLQVTISGGIGAMDSADIIAKEKIIKIADENLYQAKQTGRNRIRF